MRLHVQVTAAKRVEDNFRIADHSPGRCPVRTVLSRPVFSSRISTFFAFLLLTEGSECMLYSVTEDTKI